MFLVEQHSNHDPAQELAQAPDRLPIILQRTFESETLSAPSGQSLVQQEQLSFGSGTCPQCSRVEFLTV
jgi:hypothetical protein